MDNVFDVRAFGAEGTGESIDTEAVQAAVDACSGVAGGRVYVPAGTYTCGTIHLKSGVELYLEAGATILGSPERGDYTTKYNAAYDVDVEGRQTSASHLICAVGASSIAIRGRGTIDGNGKAFFGVEAGRPFCLVTLMAATRSSEPAYRVREPEPGRILLEAVHYDLPELRIDDRDLSIRSTGRSMEVGFAPAPLAPEILRDGSV